MIIKIVAREVVKIKIAIATGSEDLNNAFIEFSNQLDKKYDFEQVYYKKFLLENDYDICILSRLLPDETEFDSLIYSLKNKNTRVILILLDESKEELEVCIKYHIEDVLTQPVKPKDILDIIENPKTFKDIEFIYKKAGLGININSSSKKERSVTNVIKDTRRVEVINKSILAGVTNICITGLSNSAGTTFLTYNLTSAIENYANASIFEVDDIDEHQVIKKLYKTKVPVNVIDSGINLLDKNNLSIIELYNIIIVVIDPYLPKVLQSISYLNEIKKITEERNLQVIYVINKYNQGVDKIEILNCLDVYPIAYIPYINPAYIYDAAHKDKLPYEIKEIKKELEKPFDDIIKKILPSDIYKKKSKNIFQKLFVKE